MYFHSTLKFLTETQPQTRNMKQWKLIFYTWFIVLQSRNSRFLLFTLYLLSFILVHGSHKTYTFLSIPQVKPNFLGRNAISPSLLKCNWENKTLKNYNKEKDTLFLHSNSKMIESYRVLGMVRWDGAWISFFKSVGVLGMMKL